MIDYKSYGVIDYVKGLRNSTILKIAKHGHLAPEEVIKKLEYNPKETLEVRNFLRYKIAATNLHIYTDSKFDCDKLPQVVNKLRSKLLFQAEQAQIKIYDCTIEGDKIKFSSEGHKITLQTDTRLSMQTLFMQYMREVLKTIDEDWLEHYCIYFSLPKPSDPFRNYYFLENIENWYSVMDEKKMKKEMQGMHLFNIFSKLVHSDENFVLVPDGYNCKRYSLANDWPELTLFHLHQMSQNKTWPDYSYEWYCKHIDLFGWNTWALQDTGSLENWEINLNYFFNRNGRICKQAIPKDMNECVKKYILAIDPSVDVK